MDIVPVIELKAGKSARALQAKDELRYFRTDDPTKIAKHFRDQGATRLHIYDLDGARVGMPQNRDAVRDIVRRIGLPVVYGGGVRNAEVVERVLTWGVDRVMAEPHTIQDMGIKTVVERLGDKIALEIRDFQGKVKLQKSLGVMEEEVHEFAERMTRDLAWQRYIFIPAQLNGTPSTISVPQVTRFMRSAGKPTELYGRLLDLDDLEEIACAGVQSVWICEALYDGSITLPDALKAANQATIEARTQSYQQQPAAASPPPSGYPQQRPGIAPGGYAPPQPGARPIPPQQPGGRSMPPLSGTGRPIPPLPPRAAVPPPQAQPQKPAAKPNPFWPPRKP